MTALLWAQLGLLQAWILPGLAITVRRRELAATDRLLLAFPLSAVTNCVLVEAMALLGIYNRPMMVLVMLAEIGAIGWSMRQHARDLSRAPMERIRPPVVTSGPWRDAIFAGVFIAVAFEAVNGANAQLGRIFTEWDAVMSWNRWAAEWFRGEIPRHTWHYPQLIPSLISIPYVMIGDPRVQQLGRLVTMVVPVLMVATGFRLSQYAGAWRHFFAIAAAVATWRFVALLGSNQPYELADVPVAYMALAAGYAFMLAYQVSQASRQVMVVLASLVLAGAMLTKQSGVFALSVPLVWALYMRERGVPVERRVVILSAAIVAVVAGQWYAIAEARIRLGTDGSEIGTVMSLVQLPWTAKLIRGWMMLWRNQAAVAGVAAIVTAAAGAHHIGRRILLYGLLPAFLAWALFVSYDTRNFAVGVIPLACCIVFGASQLWRWASGAGHWLSTRPGLRAAAIGGVVITVVAGQLVVARRYDRDRLVERAVAQKRRLGEPDLNEFLYAVLPTLPAGLSVGTSYQYLGHLPGLEDRFVVVHCGTEAEMRYSMVAAPRYLLWLPERCSESVNRRIQAALAAQSIVTVGQHGTRVLFRVDSQERLLDRLRP